MAEMILTQVYLEKAQKQALAVHAKQTGRKASDLMRDAVDALLLGVTPTELKQLDAATKIAQRDIKDMVAAMDAGAKRHKSFMAEIGRIKAASAKA
jgi:hypothetical protein